LRLKNKKRAASAARFRSRYLTGSFAKSRVLETVP
jgi:hypothetical protein